MARRLPPLNPLRAFEAVARHGSVTRAARELNVTHSAVSHQLRVLESALDLKLFERNARRLKLTEQGALLSPSVSNAFDGIAQATAQLKRPSTRGDLSVSCPPALLSLWLLPRINEFSELFPGVRLTLSSSYDPRHVYSSEYDVCILYGDGSWSDCWVRHWAHLELFPVISPTLLNRRPLRSVRDLRHHVILHNADRREWRAWLHTADRPEIESRGTHHFLSDARLGMDAAVYGQGVALGDTMTAAELLNKGLLVMPFDRTVPAHDSFYVACRTDVRAVPIVKVFIDWLFAACDAGNRERGGRTQAGSRTHRRTTRTQNNIKYPEDRHNMIELPTEPRADR